MSYPYNYNRGGDKAKGRDLRGSNKDRARRRAFLFAKFKEMVTTPESGGFGRELVPCYHCGYYLSVTEFEVDRFPIPGQNGGRYTRDNIVPSCAQCNRLNTEEKIHAKQSREAGPGSEG